jgi:glutathione S-transferase
MIQLFDNAFSPFAFKVRATIYEKNLDVGKREIRKQADRDTLLAVNPCGEVPALADGDIVLADSKVICAYLEAKYPEPALLPTDPALRARAQYLELKADTEIDGSVFVLGLVKLMKPNLAGDVPEALPRAEAIFRRHQAFLERELAGREWFLGAFSLADVALAPHLRSAAFMGYPPGPEHPGLVAWLERARKRPSLRRATREMAEAYAASLSDPDGIFDRSRVHWRNDRIECAVRCGLGPWLLEEMAADRAFLSPIP